MSYICPKCSTVFSSRQRLDSHLEKNLPCDLGCRECDFKGRSSIHYYQHMQAGLHTLTDKISKERAPPSATSLSVRTRSRKRKLLFKKHMLSDAVSFQERNDPVNADLFPIEDVTPDELANLSHNSNDKVFVMILRD